MRQETAHVTNCATGPAASGNIDLRLLDELRHFVLAPSLHVDGVHGGDLVAALQRAVARGGRVVKHLKKNYFYLRI